jgi:hypothetical protein
MSSVLSVKFVRGNPGHWELYSEGIRIATFSVQEIAGLYFNRTEVVKEICSESFGDMILNAARVTCDQGRIVILLRRVVQTKVEHFTKE